MQRLIDIKGSFLSILSAIILFIRCVFLSSSKSTFIFFLYLVPTNFDCFRKWNSVLLPVNPRMLESLFFIFNQQETVSNNILESVYLMNTLSTVFLFLLRKSLTAKLMSLKCVSTSRSKGLYSANDKKVYICHGIQNLPCLGGAL